MKKIVFVLALFLAMNPLVSAADSPVSAKSSNCTVNTCDFVLKANSDVQGVIVSWTPSFEGATYEIFRDGTYIGFQKYPSTMFLDGDAEYGKIHTYTVRVKGTSISAVDSAQRAGTGKIPCVEQIQAADLWLVYEGPYNLQFIINDYDDTRYTVKRIHISVKGKEIAAFRVEKDKNGNYPKLPRCFDRDLSVNGAKFQTVGDHEILVWSLLL